MAGRRTFYTSDGEDEPSDPKAAFARRLNKLLLAKGWRQRDLVARMNQIVPPKDQGGKPTFGRHLTSAYMRGQNLPNQMTLDAMAKALGVKLDDLVPATSTVVVGKEPPKLSTEFYTDGTGHIRVDMRLPADICNQISMLVTQGMAQMNERRAAAETARRAEERKAIGEGQSDEGI